MDSLVVFVVSFGTGCLTGLIVVLRVRSRRASGMWRARIGT